MSATIPKKPFGTVLREYREAAAISLGALARQLGVSAAYLSDVERGNRPPLVQEKIVKAASVLDADLDLLLRVAAETKGSIQLPVGADSSTRAKEVGAMLARQWNDMSESKLRRIKQLLEEEE